MNRVEIAKLKEECLAAQVRCADALSGFGSDRDAVKLVNQDTVLELIERIEEVEGDCPEGHFLNSMTDFVGLPQRVALGVRKKAVAGEVLLLLIERNKAIRIAKGLYRQERIRQMRCSGCNHKRKAHRSDSNQMYQWFDSCRKCRCKGWQHEEGDPML
jgi:hypothetical protein